MSDRDLKVNLDAALRAVTPGAAPVDRVVRRGKGIRTRRRLTAIAGAIAVAVAVLAGYPALTHDQTAPAPAPPVTHRHTPSVTDVPPGPGARPGAIASGQIHGASWRLAVGKAGTGGLPAAPAGQTCFTVSGMAIDGPLAQCDLIAPPTAKAPVGFTAFTCGDQAAGSVGLVRADVRYVLVTLADGTRLRLIPVSFGGKRYVAFALPQALLVRSARAYLSGGGYRSAVPFYMPHDLMVFGMWQRQGQRVPARLTRTIGSAARDRWSAAAYQGPWGTCLTDSSAEGSVCIPSAAPLATQVLLVTQGNLHAVFGAAATSVSYLRVTLTHGAPLRVRAVAVGHQKFFAFLLGLGQSIRHWTAYDAAGAVLTSGGAPTR